MYTIKQVSERLKINPNALRFYEEKGLVNPCRGENGYRDYSVEDISRLEIIVLYRKMGFSIEAIGKLVQDNRNRELLNQFVAQYSILNHHIHTMCTVRETLGKCVEELLDKSVLNSHILERMEQTAEIIAISEEWEDKWDFDSWAENYDTDIRKKGSGLDFYHNYNRVLSTTANAILSGKVVEIGIGTGNLAKAALEKGILPENYIGIDQSVNMLKEARKKCPDILLRIGDFLHLPLENSTCDSIVTSYAFHHCTHEEKVLAISEMNRILKGQGRIIITDLMFTDSSNRRRYEEACTVREREDLKDEYFGNINEIEAMLSSYGFRCIHKRIDDLIWMIVADRDKK
ncbi:MerR family transcriptional regulator [Anaerocolumna jejuensis]|uniref:MerR family transcriptional regulator n=1 Tax=Anaerocolumna jejuensis TaxID=259063 RepID=UPI003F7C7380